MEGFSNVGSQCHELLMAMKKTENKRRYFLVAAITPETAGKDSSQMVPDKTIAFSHLALILILAIIFPTHGKFEINPHLGTIGHNWADNCHIYAATCKDKTIAFSNLALI